MRQSKLFTKTQKESPSDEVSKNAQLLIRAGFVDKLQAGVYTYLPLGVRVIQKIEKLVREEMNKANGQELLMPSLHPKENWEKTGRWDTMDDLYKVKDSSGSENALGPTHEEVVVPLAKKYISSYKDLPLYLYQIQTKFRMELRAKSGILRGREFTMKDLYSFHTSDEDLKDYYETIQKAYANIFKKVGLGKQTYLTYASGGSFSKYSHEFQTVTKSGEDKIYLCETCLVAINQEIISEQKACPLCSGIDFKEEKSIEVGNIFELKTKFSEPFGLTYKDEKGNEIPIIMGCYGLGITRLMGAVVECLSDEAGLVWPEAIAPYKVHLVTIGNYEDVLRAGEELYKSLQAKEIETLYDDREIGPGVKLKDADLIGIPNRVVVSEKTLKESKFELKNRQTGDVSMVSTEELFTRL